MSSKEDKKGLKPIGRLIKQDSHSKKNFVNQLSSNQALEGKIRDSKDFQFYGITKTKAGDAVLSLALKLILQDGEQLVIQYHELQSPVRFKPSDILTFSTPTLSITIEGKNLESILDYIAEHRLVWIKEPDNSFIQTKDGEPEVTSIKIEEKE
ncbi:MAG: hypothetical protein AB8G86_04805 [Saprospiraceae bacterium]